MYLAFQHAAHLRAGAADYIVEAGLLGHRQVLQVVVVPAKVRLRQAEIMRWDC